MVRTGGTEIFSIFYRGGSAAPLVWGRPKNFDQKFSPAGWAPVPAGTLPGCGREGARVGQRSIYDLLIDS